MTDWKKLIDIAAGLDVPGLAERGLKLASATAEFVAMVKANAARAGVVMATGDREMLDAIHDEALAANDSLDAKLAAAARR